MIKNVLIYCLVLFCIGKIYSQKFDGYIVTTSNDTIKCKFFVQTNMFDNTMFYANSVRNKVKILDGEGKKIKFVPSQLNSFFIRGTKFGDFKFVSFKEDNFEFFYHEIIIGKISLYRLYQEDLYSGGANSGYRYFVLKNKILSKITNFSYKSDFAVFIKDYPELYKKWMDTKSLEIKEFTKEYNEHYKI